MKVKTILVVLLLIACAGTAGFFGFEYFQSQKEFDAEVESLNNTVAYLTLQVTDAKNATVDTIDVYAVINPVNRGGVISSDNVGLVTIAKTGYNSKMVTDFELLPAYSKTDLEAGQILYSSELSYDSYYSKETILKSITFDSIPVGLAPGDYIDIKFVLPNGELTRVLSKKKVYYIKDNTIEISVSEEEDAILRGMFLDYATYKQYTLPYIERYNDAAEDGTISYYCIPTDLANSLKFDPNIFDITRVINDTYRQHIDEVLHIYTTDNNASVSSSFINILREQLGYQNQAAMEYEQTHTDEATGEYVRDGFLFGDGVESSGVYSTEAFNKKVEEAGEQLREDLEAWERLIR